MEVHEQLGCLGYSGFGSGYLDVATGYCNVCPARTECWRLHRARVQEKLPTAAKVFDEIAERHRGDPKAMMEAWWERTESKSPDPYMGLMLGNMEDGMQVAAGLEPKDRGEATLPSSVWQHLSRRN